MIQRNDRGQFIKGNKTWLGKSRKGYGLGKWMKGRKLPKKVRQKISQSNTYDNYTLSSYGIHSEYMDLLRKWGEPYNTKGQEVAC